MTGPHEESTDDHRAGTPPGESEGVDPEVEASFAGRVVTFSDAVLAIAITLLALALPAPDGQAGWTNGQLLHALRDSWPHYLAFLISFSVIGSHWAAHRRIFRYVVSMNATAARLNMAWLLMMVLTPFAANLLSGHGAFGVRFAIYVLIQVIATGCLTLLSEELARGGLLRPNAPAWARHPDHVRGLAICIPFLVSIPVAFVTVWAYAVWAAIPLTGRLLRLVMASRRPGPGHHANSASVSE